MSKENQTEMVKKMLEEFKVIGDILNDCNSEITKKSKAMQQEV